MKKVILGIGLAVLLSGSALAQTSETRGSARGSNQTSVNKSGRDVALQSGTQLSGQLQSTLDAQKARVGDQVILKTTSAVKQNGRVVVDKGSRLVGRVTEVQQRGRGNAESRIGILFDRLENGKMTLPINAVITSVTQAQSRARVDDTRIFQADLQQEARLEARVEAEVAAAEVCWAA
jgi:D-serine deaminase-like pyridoxal phosphate-dependent protein